MKTIRLEPENFCYWLQGFCEISGSVPTAEQWETIKEHLELVFTKAVPVQETIVGPGTVQEQYIKQIGGLSTPPQVMIC